MLKSESIQENETHEILWDLEIQMDHRIQAKKSDLVLVNNKRKRICHLADFAVLANHRGKMKESEKTSKNLDLA